MEPSPIGATRSQSRPCRKRDPLVVVAIAEESLRGDYASCLADNGFAAPAVASAVEALGLARRLAPEIVILDYDPEGLAAAQRLRSEPLTQHIRIVAVATPAVAERLGSRSRAEFDVVLESPCSATTLLTELLATLGGLLPDDE